MNNISRSIAGALALLAAAASTAAAQGTLTTQGFGYPPGQVSARAQATGTSFGEVDPHSPINPASIIEFGRGSVYGQYSPEVRTVTTGGGSDRSTLTRFPVASIAIPVRDRLMLGLSISTLLDRSWRTDSTFVLGSGADTTTATASFGVSGAISDVRFAAAYQLHPRLRVGVGFHALAGRNNTSRDLIIADTARFSSSRERDEFSFSGLGASAGVEWRPSNVLAIAASARTGGQMRAWRNDSILTTSSFPRRAGASIIYSGLGGVAFAVRADWEGWGRMENLSRGDTPTFDAWEYSAGVEAKGPSLGETNVPLRAGFRHRTLPFGVAGGEKVTENSVMGGLALPLARGRAGIDLTIQRDLRSAAGDAREKGWTFSTGLVVRM
ncbi:MAG TPA: hypothetical protein VFS05_05895 [Gemmatimonadaceae bacterium]|nr:hypothetical protein [Gemmatimonadaceae bacterium]